ncbi:MAG: ATP-binding protein [Chloroflexi bacterium]|nr:ATP-binding protein [Chloroflexota bacterium]
MGRSHDLFERFRTTGLEAIEKCIKDKVVEQLYLDYKGTKSQKKPGQFSEDDQANLSKAISGFGNSSGGVIVWGVDCRPDKKGVDVPTKAVPIKDVNDFRSKLENWISGLTLPPHDGVENHTILCDETGDGFLVTHIPQSNYAPIRSLRMNNYYIRAGSSFEITPHDVLAGMFGKRPEPMLETEFRPVVATVSTGPMVTFSCQIVFRNAGATIIRDVYVTSNAVSLPGKADSFHLAPGAGQGWNLVGNYENQLTAHSGEDSLLAPGASVLGATMTLLSKPPSVDSFEVEVNYGCDGGPVQSLAINLSNELFQRVYRELAAVDFNMLAIDFGGEEGAWETLGTRVHKYSDAVWIPGTPLPDIGKKSGGP